MNADRICAWDKRTRPVAEPSTTAGGFGRVSGDRHVGRLDLAKDGSTFNPGDKVYWDNVNLCDFGSPAPASTTPGNREIGVADLVQATCVSAPGGLTGDVQPM